MAITILLIIAGAFALIAGGWFVFEHFWNRRLFGGRGDSGPVKNVSAVEARALLDEASDVPLIVDVRPPAHFASRPQLPGAVSLPFPQPEFAANFARLQSDRPALIYCDGGFRSRLAVAELRRHGVTGVFHLSRGIMGWRWRKFPVKTPGNAGQ